MLRLRLALFVVLLTAVASAENAKLPNTAIGKRFAELLGAFNSGDGEQIRNFILFNYAAEALQQRSPENRAATYLELYSDTGGLQLRRVEESSDSAITVLAETRATHEWYRISCQSEPKKPYKLLGAVFRLTLRPQPFAGKGKLSDRQIVADAEQYAAQMSGGGRFGGVLLFARGSEPLLERAWPWHEKAHNENYNAGDRFGLASINKIFTAVAIAQLADAGKLAFNDPVSRFLPSFPRERGEKITIHQLLTHTAGMEPMLDADSFEAMRKAKIQTRAEQVIFLGSRPAVAAPGERFSYSNAGYWLLEAIVESIALEPFQQYAHERIFQPLGMTHTSDGESTAADLLRFGTGLTGGRLVSARALATMMKAQVKTNDPEVGYGYGLEIQEINGVRLVGHPGGGVNISAQLDIYPDENVTVIVLSRRADNTAQRIANRLRELITQR